MLRLRRESNPGPPALQANTLCKEPWERRISCHSGSQLVLLQYNVYVRKKKISFSFPQKTPKRKVHKALYSILDFYLQKLVLLALCTVCMCLSVV
jgi:hypothetical protein